MHMSFWTRLKERIKSEKTTQEWVATKIGVSHRTFRGWLSREIMPNADQVIAIARLLGTTPEFLVTGQDPEGTSPELRAIVNKIKRLPKEQQKVIIETITTLTDAMFSLKEGASEK